MNARTKSTGAVLSRTSSPAGLEAVDPQVAAQLLALGFDSSRSTYTATEIVQATVGAALTVQGFLQRTQAELPVLVAA